MKTIKLTIIALIAVFSLAGCKKDKEKTTAEKIQAKWSLVSQSLIVTPTATGSNTISSTMPGKAGEYIEFLSNGKVNIQQNGEALETTTYTIDSDAQITIDGEAFQIKTLTDNSLVLYSNDTSNSNETIQTTITLSR